MLKRLLFTTNDRMATLARLTLGFVMLPHALQKVFGLFGGYGIAGTAGYFTGALHIPAPLAYLAIAAEFLGALGLIVGFAGRGAAFGIASVMIGAVLTVHLPNGFFMNWTGQAAGEGYEYHLLALALATIVMVRGSGAFSLDRVLMRDEPAAQAPSLHVAQRAA